MSEEVKKRVRRSPEEIAAEIDVKIAAHKDAIKKLEQRKAEVLAPKKPRMTKAQKMKMVIDKAKQAGMSPEEIAEKLEMPVDKVREIMRIAQDPVSLETPIGEEEDSHLGDFIPDDDAPAPAEAASHTLLKEQLNEVLATLTDREAKVLKLRFGLEDGKSRTLEEVGQRFDVTRERIRQIEAKALRKLRHPSRSKKVKDFLD